MIVPEGLAPISCRNKLDDWDKLGYREQYTTERCLVAKPNYQFEKRQRELEKKKKKEEKAQRKAHGAPVAAEQPVAEAPEQPPVT